MRRLREEDFSVISNEIASARAEGARCDRELVGLRQALNDALAKPAREYSEGEVINFRKQIDLVEQRRRLVLDRAAALEGRLPSVDEREKAKFAADDMHLVVQREQAKALSAWSGCKSHLEQAEDHAMKLVEARASAQTAVNTLTDLVGRFGLKIEVPPDPLADSGTESKVIAMLGYLIAHVALGSPVDAIQHELAAARARNGGKNR